MARAWLVRGEAVEKVVDEMFDNPDCDLSNIKWDSFAEGITTVCVVANTYVEAVKIAKKYYGFSECSAECC